MIPVKPPEKAEPLKLSSVDLYIEALEDRETDTETLQFEDFQPPVADLSETITADEPLELQDYQSTDINFDQVESETSEPVALKIKYLFLLNLPTPPKVAIAISPETGNLKSISILKSLKFLLKKPMKF